MVQWLFDRLRRVFRKRCARCGEHALTMRNWIRATCVDDHGHRYPDSWTYYECASCGARSKWYINGRIEEASEAEWSQHCGPT